MAKPNNPQINEEVISRLLNECGGDVNKVAKRLGVTPQAIYYRLDKLGYRRVWQKEKGAGSTKPTPTLNTPGEVAPKAVKRIVPGTNPVGGNPVENRHQDNA